MWISGECKTCGHLQNKDATHCLDCECDNWVDNPPKQVIVMRKDLNMRKGKMVAQGSHASLGAVLFIQNSIELAKLLEAVDSGVGAYRQLMVINKHKQALERWLGNSFRKICVSVNSESELDDVYNQAYNADLPVKLITDLGHTEFHGIPTKTCLAIGPYWPAAIDKITGNLPLL